MMKDLMWGFPGRGKKHHIFHDGISLCGGWWYTGSDQQVTKADAEGLKVCGPRRDDCKTCVKKFLKHEEGQP